MDAALTIKPQRFGRYVLLDRIGLGGMAEVFRAVMPGAEGFKRTFVLKRILAPHNESPKFVEMFIREARIGSMFNHPNIVQVYDFGSVDGTYFLVMEYLRGRDLLAMIRRSREQKRAFPVPIAAHIAHQVAGGLSYAHALTDSDGRSLDIVHRDVSLSNIMCLREGGVKLLDFGIARGTCEGVSEHTEQGTFKGNLAYMAPERVRNEPLDGRSDLYSLGVVLWEMLTGKHLFRGTNMVDTFQKILEMAVPVPSSLRPEVPASLDAIVMRTIERDPVKRYSSGQALADDLEEVLRETKFQSQMLPRLLDDLFGAGLRTSHAALSCLTPELLASAGFSGTGTGTSWLTTGVPRWKSWRLWAAMGAGALLLALATILGVRAGRSQPPPTLPVVAPTPVATTPVRAPKPVAPVVESPTAPDEATVPPAAKIKKANTAKRLRPASKRNPIADGLSIDPFAEAATRRQP